MHMVSSLSCFALLHRPIWPLVLRHLDWGNQTIVPVPAKQPWRILVNKPHGSTMNCYTTTMKQYTAKSRADFLEQTVFENI